MGQSTLTHLYEGITGIGPGGRITPCASSPFDNTLVLGAYPKVNMSEYLPFFREREREREIHALEIKLSGKSSPNNGLPAILF